MTLGQQIKKIRVAKGLSQPALAEATGIEQSYLSKLENDKSVPSNDMFRKLLSGLDVSIEALLTPLDNQHIHSTLRQISDVEEWLTQRHNQRQQNSRKMLLISSALIVIATTFFYTGYTQLLFATVEHKYLSKGVIKPGEPYDFFEGGAFTSARGEEHDAVREVLRERYNPDTFKTFNQKGHDFIVEVEGGSRRYVLRDAKNMFKVTRIENVILQIAGVFLFSCGVAGFILERRFNQLSK